MSGELHQQGELIPDVEEAANAATEEEKEDSEATNLHHASEDEQQVDGDDEGYESQASGEEEERSNPLQVDGSTNHGGTPQEEEADQPLGVEVDSDGKSEDDNDPDDLHDTPHGNSSERQPTPAASQAQSQPKTKQQQLARGKRTKAKRAAKKYAEQDEEDRALAMQLLGSNRAQERKGALEADKAAREAKAQADKERRKAQHAKAAEKERLRRGRLEKAAAEGTEAADLDEDDEQSKEQLEQERRELLDIDRLVPMPEPGDELLAAIPVVAPWTALSRQKYKIKLQPGNMKKGKAVREILGFWTSLATRGPKVLDENSRDREKVWRREVDLLKDWRVEEVVGYVPVKGCRIVQGGGLGGGVGGAGGASKGKGGGSGGGKGKAGGKGGSKKGR